MRNKILATILTLILCSRWRADSHAQIEQVLTHEELESQNEQFQSAIFLQEGKQAAGMCRERVVVWDVESGETLREKKLEGENFAWDEGGESIVYRSYNGERYGLVRCRLSDFQVTALPIFEDWTPIGLSQSGRLLCHSYEKMAYQVFTLPGGAPVLPEAKLIRPGREANMAAISPNGRQVAVAFSKEEDAVRLYELDEQKWGADSKGYLGQASKIRFSPDSQSLAVSCRIAQKGVVVVLNAKTLQPVGKPFPNNDRFLILPDNRRILIMLDVPTLFDIPNHQQLAQYYGMHYDIQPVFARSGNRLIVPSRNHGKLDVWDWTRALKFQPPEHTYQTHRPLPKDKNRSDRPIEVAYHPSGKFAALSIGALGGNSGSAIGLSVVQSALDSVADGKLITGKELQDAGKISTAYFLVVELETGQVKSLGNSTGLTSGKSQLSGDKFTGLKFSPDGKQLCTLFGYDGHLILWDTTKKQARPSFQLVADHQDSGYGWNDVVFAKDGTQLYLISKNYDKGLQIFDLVQRKLIKQQKLGDNDSPNLTMVNNRQFVCGLSIWDRENFTEEFKSNHSYAYEFRTKKVNDRMVAALYRGELMLFDLESRRLKKPFISHQDDKLETHGFDVSHDGKMIATACNDGLIRLWETATGQLLINLKGHQGPVESVAFSPDDTVLLSASNDGTTRSWSVKDFATGSPVDAKLNIPTHAEFPLGDDGKVTVSFDRPATAEEIIEALEAALAKARSSK